MHTPQKNKTTPKVYDPPKCPSCGAGDIVDDKCAYCGSMRIVMMVADNITLSRLQDIKPVDVIPVAEPRYRYVEMGGGSHFMMTNFINISNYQIP